jgi:multisubunit Na+/H+ antiporter MnhB subunit
MLPALFLTLSAILYHLLYVLAGSPANWANFSPVAAVFLCSGAFLHRRAAFLWPLLALFVSDLIINGHYHIPLVDTRMIPGYFCFVLFLMLGRWLAQRRKARALWMLGGAVTASLIFYVVTNSVDWLFDSAVPYAVEIYPKTFAGWVQALTVGHPNFPPTYLFLRNTLVSDLVFTSAFLLTQHLFRSPAKESVPIVPPEKSQTL